MISTKAVGRGEQKNEDSAKHLYSSDMMQLYLASEKNERSRKISSRKHCNRKQRHTSYLSFFTQAKFLENGTSAGPKAVHMQLPVQVQYQ